MMKVGMLARFVPFYNESEKLSGYERRKATISATIVYINQPHKYFTAEWSSQVQRFRESFKFSDIGKRVTVGGK